MEPPKPKLRTVIVYLCCLFLFFALVIVGGHFYYLHLHPKQTYFKQKLDHFSSDQQTFKQQFIVDTSHWNGNSTSPVFVVLFGADSIQNYPGQIGILNLLLVEHQGIALYIEHRYYGESVPFGWSSMDAIVDPGVRENLTTKQALADYKEIISSLKTKYSIVKAPVILLGHFYGGFLATWMMMEYPDVAIGAIVSSAPFYYIYDNPEYRGNDICTIVSDDFEAFSPQCREIIISSWLVIDDIASQPNGLKDLSRRFSKCSPIQSAYELKVYLAHLYTFVAQYTSPLNHWMEDVCDLIVNSLDDEDILKGIYDAVLLLNADASCINIFEKGDGVPFISYKTSMTPWFWQQCNEIGILPSNCNNNTMLPSETFDESDKIIQCQKRFGKSPPVKSIGNQYGGSNLKLALSSIRGKLIMSNEKMDPYSGQGVLYNISEIVTAIITEQGSHMMDFQKETSSDPQWLIDLRLREDELVNQWLGQYFRQFLE